MERDSNKRCDDKETDNDDEDEDNEEEFLPGFTTYQDYSKVFHWHI